MKLKSRPCRRKSRHQDLDTKARPDWHSNTKTPLEVTRNIAFQLNSLNPNFLVTIMTQGRMMIDLSELTLQIKWAGALFKARLKTNNYLKKMKYAAECGESNQGNTDYKIMISNASQIC